MLKELITNYKDNELKDYIYISTALFLLKLHNELLGQNHHFLTLSDIRLFLEKEYPLLAQDFIIQVDIFNYQEIYKSLIVEQSVIENDTFGSLYQKLQSSDHKKDTGQFFTNVLVAKKMNNEYQINHSTKVIDLSCGSGVFFLELLNKAYQNFDRNIYKHFVENNIFGVELDSIAIWIAKINILSYSAFLFKDNISISFLNLINDNALTFNEKQKFDIVIGNPPYVDSKRLSKEDKEMHRNVIPEACYGAYDLYILFIEKGLRLLKENGYLLYLIPNKFCIAHYGKYMRKKILENYKLEKVIDFANTPLFEAEVFSIVLKIKNTKEKSESIYIEQNENLYEIATELYINSINNIFVMPPNIHSETEANLFYKIVNLPNRLSDFLEVKNTIKFGKKGVHDLFISKEKIDGYYKFLGGKTFGRLEVKPYQINWDEYWFKYDRGMIKEYNLSLAHLNVFLKPKIFFPQNSINIMAVLDDNQFLAKNSYVLANSPTDNYDDLLYFTGFLNSYLANYIYKSVFKHSEIRGGYFRYYPSYVGYTPIKQPTNEHKEKIIEWVSAIRNDISLYEEVNHLINEEIFSFYNINKDEQLIIKKFYK